MMKIFTVKLRICANFLIRRFSKCSFNFEIILFKSFCLGLFDVALWKVFKAGSVLKFQSCYTLTHKNKQQTVKQTKNCIIQTQLWNSLNNSFVSVPGWAFCSVIPCWLLKKKMMMMIAGTCSKPINKSTSKLLLFREQWHCWSSLVERQTMRPAISESKFLIVLRHWSSAEHISTHFYYGDTVDCESAPCKLAN